MDTLNLKILSKQISKITLNERNLLYYYPWEIRRAIKKGQCAFLHVAGEIAGFGFLNSFGNNTEISTCYIFPQFRGRGYFNNLFRQIFEKSKHHSGKLFLFTKNPTVEYVAQKLNFQRADFFALPLNAWLRILKHRLSLPRIRSYAKLFRLKNLIFLKPSKLYVYENKDFESGSSNN